MPEGGPWKVRFETAEDRGRRRNYGSRKTREFSAQLISFVTANGYFDLGQHNPLRPVLAVFAMSRAAEGPFVANLRAGRRLRIDGLGGSREEGLPLEFMKSAGYEVRPQRLEWITRTADGEQVQQGTVLDVFVRDLYEFSPVIANEEEVCFLISESVERYQREAAGLSAPLAKLVLRQYQPREGERDWEREKRVAEAGLGTRPVSVDPEIMVAEGRRFAAAIDRRADVPLLADPLFGVQLLCSALARGYALRSQHSPPFSPHETKSFCEVGVERTKRAPGLAFKMRQDSLEKWLAAEVAAYDELRRAVGARL